MRGCRALTSILPGPEMGENKFEWFSRGFNFKPTKPSLEENNAADNGSAEEGFLFTCVYEWRLNMVTREVRERNLSGTYFSMDFPVVNADFTGLKHKYGYTQVVDSEASSSCGNQHTKNNIRGQIHMEIFYEVLIIESANCYFYRPG